MDKAGALHVDKQGVRRDEYSGVDLDAVTDIGDWITKELGKGNESAVGRAVLGARERAKAA